MNPAGWAEHLARLESGLELLPDKPDETPESTLRTLWSLAAGHPLSLDQARAVPPRPLDEAQRDELSRLVELRLEGTPLAHLTGLQDFMGLVLRSSPAALVPRRETELLVSRALEKLGEVDAPPSPLVLDVCTGSGNVALAISAGAPHARVLGSDLSPEAVELARENARFVGHPDVEFRVGDLLGPFEDTAFLGSVDILACNPPYISSARVAGMAREIRGFEPALAFDGGAFGVSILRRLVSDAPRWLRPGGWLLTEVGVGQGSAVARLLERSPGFDRVESTVDPDGESRVVAARRSAHPPDPPTPLDP